MDPTEAEVRDGFLVQAPDGTKFEDGLRPSTEEERQRRRAGAQGAGADKHRRRIRIGG